MSISSRSIQFRSVEGLMSSTDPTARLAATFDSPRSRMRSSYIRTARARVSSSYLRSAGTASVSLRDQSLHQIQDGSVHVMNEAGAPMLVTTAAPDAGGLASLSARIGAFEQPVRAAIESMTGARFVHDQLELHGWDVQVADAVKVKGLAPLAAKTDRIDAWVLAELSRRDLVPAIWLPTPGVRAERERGRRRVWQGGRR